MKTQFPLRKDQDDIHLIQLLKATNMVDNGALAQELVVEGEVKVNGEVEYQKRKKRKDDLYRSPQALRRFACGLDPRARRRAYRGIGRPRVAL